MATSSGDNNRILTALSGRRPDRPPFWFMRQAGRYLPEYRTLRKKAGSFLDLVFDSVAAAEVTCQPVRRLGCDAAILFSDILVIPYALGQEVRFRSGEGPQLEPISDGDGVARLTEKGSADRLQPIYETVRRVREQLDGQTCLIGFCGGLWTVASYMIAGRGGDDQTAAKRFAYGDPNAFGALMAILEEASAAYLIGQIQAGAQALQIFESWAGQLPEPAFETWIIAPTRRLVERVRSAAPDIPIIGFPRGAGGLLGRYARETGIDAVSLDTGMSPGFVAQALPVDMPVQGNLDPQMTAVGGEVMLAETTRILKAFSDRPHIFNLGHGFSPDTPVGNVEALAAFLRGWPETATGVDG